MKEIAFGSLGLPSRMDVGSESWATEVVYSIEGVEYVTEERGALTEAQARGIAASYAGWTYVSHAHKRLRYGSDVEIRAACGRIGLDPARVCVTRWNVVTPPCDGARLVDSFRVRTSDPAMGVWLLPEGAVVRYAGGVSPVATVGT